jgi:CRP-like cAMP-binding protein
MITTKTLHNNPCFSKLNQNQLNYLIGTAREATINEGEFVCKINTKLDHFFLILSGKMEVLFEVPEIHTNYSSPGTPSKLETECVHITQLNPGDICGWSALVPPHISTSSVKAIIDSSIVAFNCTKLLLMFEEDCRFGYFMLQAAAQAIGNRLRAIYHLPETG